MRVPHCVLRLVSTAALVVAAAPVGAMGLGEIEHQSTLGQPLQILIPVDAGDDEHISGAVVRIGSSDEYQRNGMDRPQLYDESSVRFLKRGGTDFIEVTSPQRVREPILNLIIEVICIDGSVWRRIYDVLLDPPDISMAPAQSPASPQTATEIVESAPPATSLITTVPQALIGAVPAAASAMTTATKHRRHRQIVRQDVPEPQISDSSIVPVLGQPVLHWSTSLEHPPFVFNGSSASSNSSPQLLAAYGVEAEPRFAAPAIPATASVSSPAAVHSTAEAADSGNGYRWLLAFVLGAVGYVLWKQYRVRSAPLRPEPEEIVEPVHTHSAVAEPAISEEVLPPSIAALAAAPIPEPRKVSRPREVVAQAEEPLKLRPEEALDFYKDVANLLQAELDKDPKRRDLRYKLLEVFYAANLKEEFREQTRFYLEQLEGRADDQWPEIVRMGRQLLPDSSLYGDTPLVMARTTVQTLPVAAPQSAPSFKRFYESVNQAKLSARQAELEVAWAGFSRDPAFEEAFRDLLRRNMQRPTPLLPVEHIFLEASGAQIFRKFEDKRGSSDIPLINACGQVLLGSRMGKKRMVTATIEGVHGVAVATAAEQLGLRCSIYMTQAAQDRHSTRLRRMRELGADVITVHPSMVASNEDVRIRALEDWIIDAEGSFYVNSIDAGPYPYPAIVLHFQSVVGREAHAQMIANVGLPDVVIAGTGDGISAIGLLGSYLNEKQVRLYCVETTAPVKQQKSRHRFNREHAWLRISNRITYLTSGLDEAMQATADAERLQGWTLELPAAEVLAQARILARQLKPEQKILVMLPKPEVSEISSQLRRSAG